MIDYCAVKFILTTYSYVPSVLDGNEWEETENVSLAASLFTAQVACV